MSNEYDIEELTRSLAAVQQRLMGEYADAPIDAVANEITKCFLASSSVAIVAFYRRNEFPQAIRSLVDKAYLGAMLVAYVNDIGTEKEPETRATLYRVMAEVERAKASDKAAAPAYTFEHVFEE